MDRSRHPFYPARHQSPQLTLELVWLDLTKEQATNVKYVSVLGCNVSSFRHLLRELKGFGGNPMARPKSMEKMSLAELSKMQANIERVKVDKQNSERTAVREKIMSIAKEHGFDIHELFGRKGNGKGTRGKVAIKYRDNAGNTWTGRGRMPRWMVAATKGGKAKKEDFLIK
jgi:DNA-binding protein H-NS